MSSNYCRTFEKTKTALSAQSLLSYCLRSKMFRLGGRAGIAIAILMWLCLGSASAATSPEMPTGETIPIAQASPSKKLYVNPNTGSDTGDGSERAPFRTITQALNAAEQNTVILLAPGTYSAQTGETFPIKLKPGVTIQGDPSTKGQRISIVGGGYFLSPTFATQDITILGADGATLSGVTVTNPNDRGYGLWIESSSPTITDSTFIGSTHDGISIVGNSAPVIRGNYFSRNGANGMTIYGTSKPQVEQNTFENTGYAININQSAAPVLSGNIIIRNRAGVLVQANGRPVLRNNKIEGNQQDGVVAISQAQPDLGRAEQPGGNIIRNNGQYDINAKATTQIIPVYGNQLSNRTLGRLDFTGRVSVAPPPVEIRPVPKPIIASPPPRQPAAVTPPPLPRNNSSVSASNFPRLNIPTDNRPIPIPVPPPETSSPSPTSGTVSSEISPPANVLPVPSTNIPGGSARPPLRSPLPSNLGPAVGEPPPPPAGAVAKGLRYRVIVEVNGEREQARVRRLAPEAFVTVIDGQTVMQAGMFSERNNALELLQMLQSNGLKASLQELQ
ncbi:MAG: DUF1565 domain-containing protein [Oscillatoriaceae bacterium SKW80]|nr:DUF1565 domain-containing protein [Oscillatoriaceae bacterium SKYG93]MCX8120981.1 DUF1565 domain-containing protein [Oscillatoriaceae bacterium SKW80]MDW8452254.1 DUF1565 domain-containing protein [Oscillatoriaceae cyanobacterium SKYGB_i_bin93]HIK26589.1 DUF1565 domain-containing protein [Oscillatoriaceae cyanobacterium M7585_C2015_266]